MFAVDSCFPEIALRHSGLLGAIRPCCLAMDICFHQIPSQPSGLLGAVRPLLCNNGALFLLGLAMFQWHLCPLGPHFVKAEPWIYEIPGCHDGQLSSIRLCCVTGVVTFFAFSFIYH